jgi:hypothetical protein
MNWSLSSQVGTDQEKFVKNNSSGLQLKKKRKGTIFWDITLCSPMKANHRFGGTLVDFQWTTWRYIREDSTLHNHRCENLKSYIINSDSSFAL